MTITYGFYNSINNDRLYNAEQMSSIFDGIINDGVFLSIGDKLMVSPSSGMDVVVGTGRAWFNHTWTINDADILVTIPESELVLDRIDAVVLEINASQETRANTIKVIKGTPSSNPVAPILQATNYINQHPLALVYVAAGVTEIVAANITNKVGTSDCPFVTGILETMDVDALLVQWDAEFHDWFAASEAEFDAWYTTNQDQFYAWFAMIQEVLDANTAGNLLNLINQNTADITQNTNDIAANTQAIAENTLLIQQTNQAITNHISEAMPHTFVDGATTYRWGLSVVDGVLTMNYEEVV